MYTYPVWTLTSHLKTGQSIGHFYKCLFLTKGVGKKIELWMVTDRSSWSSFFLSSVGSWIFDMSYINVTIMVAGSSKNEFLTFFFPYLEIKSKLHCVWGCKCEDIYLHMSWCPWLSAEQMVIICLLCPKSSYTCLDIKTDSCGFCPNVLFSFFASENNFITSDSQWLWRLNTPRSNIFILIHLL